MVVLFSCSPAASSVLFLLLLQLRLMDRNMVSEQDKDSHGSSVVPGSAGLDISGMMRSDFSSQNPFLKIPNGFNIGHSFPKPMEKDSYLAWRCQFLDVLAIYDLSFVIDSSYSPPSALTSEGNANPEYGNWMRLNKLVLSWIRATVSAPIQSTLISCTSAVAAWNLLEKRLSSVSKSHVRNLRDTLRKLEKSATMSMTDFLHSAKGAFDALAAAGSPISEADLIEYVILGLGSEYQSIVSVIDIHPPDSFDDLYDLLVHEESLHIRNNKVASYNGTAFHASTSHQNNNRGHGNRFHGNYASRGRRRNDRGRGYWHRSNINRDYHRNQHQHNRSWNQNMNSLPPLLPTPSSILPTKGCQICDKQGHSARVCPQRGNFAYSADLYDGLQNMSIAGSSDPTWCLDSGASHHMTHSIQAVSNPTPSRNSAGQSYAQDSSFWTQP